MGRARIVSTNSGFDDMRNIKKINSIIKQYGSTPHSPGGNAASAEAAIGMGHRYDGALEKAARKRRLQAEAEARARRFETEVHAAIGMVLDNAAAIKQLEPVDVLGLADLLKELLDNSEVRFDIRTRGLRLYSEQFVRAVALTVLGAPSDPDIAAALRATGFVRAGQLWSGKANIPEAVRLATQNGLTLMRYDADDTPVYFVRKGEKQPALAELEAEHEQMLAAANANLPATTGQADQAIPSASDGVGDGDTGDDRVADTDADAVLRATTAQPSAGSGGASFGRIGTAKPVGQRAEPEATK